MNVRQRAIILWLQTRLGVWGFVGIGLLIFSLVIAWGLTRPLKLQSDAAQQRIENFSLSAKTIELAEVKRTQAPTLKNAAINAMGQLPRHKEVTPVVMQLYELAQAQQIQATEASLLYSVATASQGAFVRITLPVQGEYVALRKFLTSALNAFPALALSEVNFKREDPQQTLLTTQVRFVLYLRS